MRRTALRRCTCKVNEQRALQCDKNKRKCMQTLLLWPAQHLTWALFCGTDTASQPARPLPQRVQLHDCATGRPAMLHVIPCVSHDLLSQLYHGCCCTPVGADHCPPGAILEAVGGGGGGATEAADRELWVGAHAETWASCGAKVRHQTPHACRAWSKLAACRGSGLMVTPTP